MANLVYLASPYAHFDPGVREQRFTQVAVAAGHWMKQGIAIYCPIVHNHTIHTMVQGMPDEHDFWIRHCIAFLRHCSRMWVLRLDGYQDSKGIKRELNLALEAGIPVEYVDMPDGLPIL